MALCKVRFALVGTMLATVVSGIRLEDVGEEAMSLGASVWAEALSEQNQALFTGGPGPGIANYFLSLDIDKYPTDAMPAVGECTTITVSSDHSHGDRRGFDVMWTKPSDITGCESGYARMVDDNKGSFNHEDIIYQVKDKSSLGNFTVSTFIKQHGRQHGVYGCGQGQWGGIHGVLSGDGLLTDGRDSNGEIQICVVGFDIPQVRLYGKILNDTRYAHNKRPTWGWSSNRRPCSGPGGGAWKANTYGENRIPLKTVCLEGMSNNAGYQRVWKDNPGGCCWRAAKPGESITYGNPLNIANGEAAYTNHEVKMRTARKWRVSALKVLQGYVLQFCDFRFKFDNDTNYYHSGAKWSISTSEGEGAVLLDDNPSTCWIGMRVGDQGTAYFIIDFGEEKTVEEFSWMQGTSDWNAQDTITDQFGETAKMGSVMTPTGMLFEVMPEFTVGQKVKAINQASSTKPFWTTQYFENPMEGQVFKLADVRTCADTYPAIMEVQLAINGRWQSSEYWPQSPRPDSSDKQCGKRHYPWPWGGQMRFERCGNDDPKVLAEYSDYDYGNFHGTTNLFKVDRFTDYCVMHGRGKDDTPANCVIAAMDSNPNTFWQCAVMPTAFYDDNMTSDAGRCSFEVNLQELVKVTAVRVMSKKCQLDSFVFQAAYQMSQDYREHKEELEARGWEWVRGEIQNITASVVDWLDTRIPDSVPGKKYVIQIVKSVSFTALNIVSALDTRGPSTRTNRANQIADDSILETSEQMVLKSTQQPQADALGSAAQYASDFKDIIGGVQGTSATDVLMAPIVFAQVVKDYFTAE